MSEFDDQTLSLYTGAGERKYVNHAERRRVLEVMQRLERGRALFSLLLAWTGGRVSEVLAVRANSFQIERNVVALRTLKRRRPHVREVPIAPGLMAAIDRHFGLKELQQNPETANERLWPLSRVQRWMGHARISTTAIYADAMGDEEAAFAARFWDALHRSE